MLRQYAQTEEHILIFATWVWDWESGIVIGDWGWGLGLDILIGDLRLAIGIEDWD